MPASGSPGQWARGRRWRVCGPISWTRTDIPPHTHTGAWGIIWSMGGRRGDDLEHGGDDPEDGGDVWTDVCGHGWQEGG
eukprot:1543586-Lingulodinium_polyedra.AAC.1